MIPVPEVIEALIHEVTGPMGLLVAAVYSLLVAAVLPFPGELVLAIPLDLGFDPLTELALLVVASSAGKAVGSLVALRVGNGARTGVFDRLFGQLPTVVSLQNAVPTDLMTRYGYLGLGVGLAIPFLPDTAIIYAFSVLEMNYAKFAVAAFLGTVVRLLAVAGIVGGAMALT
ncbi:VTT domain-containing protein [Halomarina salina]|uniref:VTT domain-containing protein n=1 Tax=Halomarina salina TaxID=1872699 RepID=A0ABD5RL29_9EURY|nr:VTT domain-containing protein [Halomarina salina]